MWSSDIATATPPRQSTARESPALATVSVCPRSTATTGGSSRRCRVAVPLSGALGLHEAAAAAEGHLVVVEVRNSPGPLQPSELLGTATFPLSEVRDFRGGATAAFAAGRTTGNEEDLELWLVPPEVT